MGESSDLIPYMQPILESVTPELEDVNHYDVPDLVEVVEEVPELEEYGGSNTSPAPLSDDHYYETPDGMFANEDDWYSFQYGDIPPEWNDTMPITRTYYNELMRVYNENQVYDCMFSTNKSVNLVIRIIEGFDVKQEVKAVKPKHDMMIE